MHFLDIVILILLGIGFFKGFRKGLVIELASLAALFLGDFAGIYFCDFVSGLLINNFSLNASYSSAIAFIIVFIAVLIMVRVIAKMIEKLMDLVSLGFFNKLFGALFSLLKYAFIISLLFYILCKLDINQKIITPDIKEKSLLYKPVSVIAPFSIPLIKKEINIIKSAKE
jgi:membrane protein required for colicin V production